MPKRILFSLLMAAMILIPVGLFVQLARTRLPEYLVEHAASFLSDEEREKVYARVAREFAGIYDGVPEPHVGKLLQRGTRKTQRGAEVVSNNAGLRSSKPYRPKEPDAYRIVCLGDSFVEGTGGSEEDRFCNQIEAILGSARVQPGGRKVETYALGVGSWSALNEATYLTSRLSDYDPDLILVMFVGNDITDTQGVTGVGTANNRYTPEHRDAGSGVFLGSFPAYYGLDGYNHLHTDLVPESSQRWLKAFTAYKRLEELQRARGRKMLMGVLTMGPYFDGLTKLYAEKVAMTSPLLVLDFEGNSLEHDPHPNRLGHQILAAHYLHTLSDLGWLDIEASALPQRPMSYDTRQHQAPDLQALAAFRAQTAAGIPERIHFDHLDDAAVLAILGGIWPDSRAVEKRAAYPYGSLKGGFVLRRKTGASSVHVTIRVPAKEELYPLTVTMLVDGVSETKLELGAVSDAGSHTLSADIPTESSAVLEIMLHADSYWTLIDDPGMKSYQLVEARQD